MPGYRLVDTCAAEFEAYTTYFYSTYGDENEARDTGRKKILILGGGPNRIGPVSYTHLDRVEQGADGNLVLFHPAAVGLSLIHIRCV